jgi:hypothetical protein
MKSADIFWVSVGGGDGQPKFAWKWRSEDRRKESASAFVYFYECVEDAKRNGYMPHIDGEPLTQSDAHRVDLQPKNSFPGVGEKRK